MSKEAIENHRTRVGAQRREKTRVRLLQSALSVFTRKGLDGTVIDDVIAEAGVSRGTFYNHFNTIGELLLALAVELSDEALAFIDPAVLHFTDPLLRFSTGTRLYMRTALYYPDWGRFVTSVGTRIAARGQLLDKCLTRDISNAIALKRVTVPNMQVARDILLGSIFYGIETLLSEPTHERHADLLVTTMLRGMGVSAADADRIASMELPEIWPMTGPLFSTIPLLPKPTAKPRRKPAAGRKPSRATTP